MKADHTTLRVALRRPAMSSALLFVLYVILSFAMDGGGYLGTDTGAKVATLDHMVEQDMLRPVVGYWAEEWDPEGDYHPLFDSTRNADGEWINVTTLPMLVSSVPLYDIGGYRLALLFPMLGAVLAALAARDIARQISDDGSGGWAFWIVGLASPMVVYALDFWEHSLGAGLMLVAVAALLRAADGDRRAIWPLIAGVAFGASATMRTETFVVTLAAVGCICVFLVLRKRLPSAVRTGVLSVVGFAIPWLANRQLEGLLGGRDRGARTTGAAQRRFWTEIGERVDEAGVTWVGFPGIGYPGGVIVGALVLMLFLGAVVLHRRGEQRAMRIALAFGAAIYVVVLADAGLTFVPGALIASPVAIAAFWSRRPSNRELLLLVIALSATVVTWTFQYLGGAGPQWGGRYLLAPTLLLTTLGAVQLAETPRAVAVTVAVLAVGVSAFGVAWLSERSHEVDRYFEDLASQPEDVVISTNGFFVREGGPAYEDRLYLSLGRDADLAGAVDVVADAGLDTFAVLTGADEPPKLEASVTGSDRMGFLGVSLWYHRYEIVR